MSLTEKGWPRPIIGGWPIPWASPPDELAGMDPERKAEVIEYGLCQVCGLGHEKDGTVYVFVNEPPPADPTDKVVKAMDDALLHERCMKLARGRCPGLAATAAAGKLWLLRAPYSAVRVHQPGGDEEDFLGIDFAECEVVS